MADFLNQNPFGQTLNRPGTGIYTPPTINNQSTGTSDMYTQQGIQAAIANARAEGQAAAKAKYDLEIAKAGNAKKYADNDPTNPDLDAQRVDQINRNNLASSTGALFTNPLLGGAAGAGVSMLYDYFLKKYNPADPEANPGHNLPGGTTQYGDD